MEKKIVEQADNLEVALKNTCGVSEEECLKGKLRATHDSQTPASTESTNEQSLEDEYDDYAEEYWDELAREAFHELFSGNLSPEVIKAAFRVVVIKED